MPRTLCSQRTHSITLNCGRHYLFTQHKFEWSRLTFPIWRCCVLCAAQYGDNGAERNILPAPEKPFIIHPHMWINVDVVDKTRPSYHRQRRVNLCPTKIFLKRTFAPSPMLFFMKKTLFLFHFWKSLRLFKFLITKLFVNLGIKIRKGVEISKEKYSK